MMPSASPRRVPASVDAHVVDLFGPYLGLDNLNLGCARNHLDGFTNLDCSPNVGADVVWDLHDLPLPFEDNRWDCIFGSHVFEHICRERFIQLAGELQRILRPGGYLISVTPYCSSDDAIDNPFHLQTFSEITWHYADQRIYQTPGTAGYGDFGVDWDLPVIATHFVPYPEHRHAPDLDIRRRHWRNVIQELHVVMQKPRRKDG